MQIEQWLSVGLIVTMMAAFVWGRIRYDLVAAGTLVAAIALGLVPAKAAFSGFADDIVIIVGSALIVSAAISHSGVMEAAVRRYVPDGLSLRGQLTILVVGVAVLSAFIKNIGALAIMIPVAIQMARKSGVSPSIFLMPMAFASLLGGLMTLVGTSPNIIVSRVREQITGTPFRMFDYLPVGAALTVAGLIFLVIGYRLLPARAREQQSLDEALKIANYTTEARVDETSAAVGMAVSALQKAGDGAAIVTAIIGAGDDDRRRMPLPDSLLRAGDVLLIEGDHEALDRLVSFGELTLRQRSEAGTPVEAGAAGTADGTADGAVNDVPAVPGAPAKSADGKPNDKASVEAVVGEQSPLIGLSARDVSLFHASGLTILAVSRRNKRFSERLGEIKIRHGDVIVLQGRRDRLPSLLRDWDCLPLVERDLKLGTTRSQLLPVAILVVAMAVTAAGWVPVAVSFFTAALLMVLTGAVPVRDVYRHLDVPILVMLAALIPVSQSLEATGTTKLIAAGLSQLGSGLPAYGALALIMVAAMAVTPFLNNAATVLVMAPIAAGFATQLGFRPEAFLMAVAIGAGSDFLTPIGHQCNTLVMGPGGYRFGDYWRLGLPLSITVVVVSVPALMWVWPMQ